MCVSHAAEVNRELLAFLRETAQVRPQLTERHRWPSSPGSCWSRPPRASSTRPRRRRSSTSSSPPPPARCSRTCRPRRSTSCPSRRSGSPCRPRSATSACASSAPSARPGCCRSSSTCTAAAGSSATPPPTTGSSASSRSGARAALLFVEYPNAPEAHYPVAIEQGYADRAVGRPRGGRERASTPAAWRSPGESVGGNMAAALTLMAKERGDVTLRADVDVLPGHRRGDGHRLLRRVRRGLLPHPQGDGVVLGRLRPGPRPSGRRSPPRPTRPPPSSSRGLPPTLLLVDEADPLRDEGEAYAAKLRAAGVAVTTVRYDGVVHDFMLLNAMSEATATRAAIAQATAFLRAALGDGVRPMFERLRRAASSRPIGA